MTYDCVATHEITQRQTTVLFDIEQPKDESDIIQACLGEVLVHQLVKVWQFQTPMLWVMSFKDASQLPELTTI